MYKPKGKGKIGRPPVHGGYSLMRKGETPQNRRYVRAYLIDAREGLIKDLGPTEADLSMAQLVLVDRVVTKLGIIRLIEEHVKDNGVFIKGLLNPALSDSYLSYSNSVRLCLQALGINTRKGNAPLNLGKYIELKDADKPQGDPS